jgi:hypothetical protein
MYEICAVCPNAGRLQCSQCKLVLYCSKECQLKHFKCGHKKKCKDVSDVERILREEETMIRTIHYPNDPFATDEGNFGELVETQRYMCYARIYLAALDAMQTVRSIRKLINHMKNLQFLCLEDRSRVPFRIPRYLLQLPDPDSLQNCYNLVTYCALHSPSETSLLPDYEHLGYNMFDKLPRKLVAGGIDMGHCVAFVLVKVKLYVDLKRFVDTLDAVLIQRDGRWNNSVIVANILPFIWPTQNYLSPAYICKAAGTPRATVGALRTLLRRLKKQLQVPLPRIAQISKENVWYEMVNTPYAEMHARTMVAALRQQLNPQAASEESEANDVLLCDFIPILHGDPFPTLTGVLDVLQRFASGRDY